MFTCSFLGSFAYVPGLEVKLRDIVNEICAAHKKIRFLTHSVDSYVTLCSQVVLEAKQKYMGSDIQLLTVLYGTGNVHRFSRSPKYDGTLAVAPPDQPLQWMARHSDCLVTNVYEAFRDTRFAFLKQFCLSPACTVLDVTDDSVTKLFYQNISRLSVRERQILTRVDRHEPMKSIASDYGISPERVRQIDVQARRKLKAFLRDIYEGQYDY